MSLLLFKFNTQINETHTGLSSDLRVAATTWPNEPDPRSFPISYFARSAEMETKI